MFNLNEKYFSISERCGRNDQNKFCIRPLKGRFYPWELTGICSGNFIIFCEFLWFDQNRSVLPVSIGELTRWELKLFVQVHLKLEQKRLETSRKRFPTEDPLNGQIILFSHKPTKIMKKINYQRNSPWNEEWERLDRFRRLPRGQRNIYCSRKYCSRIYFSFSFIFFAWNTNRFRSAGLNVMKYITV